MCCYEQCHHDHILSWLVFTEVTAGSFIWYSQIWTHVHTRRSSFGFRVAVYRKCCSSAFIKHNKLLLLSLRSGMKSIRGWQARHIEMESHCITLTLLLLLTSEKRENIYLTTETDPVHPPIWVGNITLALTWGEGVALICRTLCDMCMSLLYTVNGVWTIRLCISLSFSLRSSLPLKCSLWCKCDFIPYQSSNLTQPLCPSGVSHVKLMLKTFYYRFYWPS